MTYCSRDCQWLCANDCYNRIPVTQFEPCLLFHHMSSFLHVPCDTYWAKVMVTRVLGFILACAHTTGSPFHVALYRWGARFVSQNIRNDRLYAHRACTACIRLLPSVPEPCVAPPDSMVSVQWPLFMVRKTHAPRASRLDILNATNMVDVPACTFSQENRCISLSSAPTMCILTSIYKHPYFLPSPQRKHSAASRTRPAIGTPLGLADMRSNTPLVSTLLCLAGTAVLAYPAASGGEAKIAPDALTILERRNYSPSAPYFVEYFDAYASGVTGAPPVADVSVCRDIHQCDPVLSRHACRVIMSCQCTSGSCGLVVADFNSSILAFLLLEGAWDNAEGWTELSASDRSTTKAAYNDAGIALMVAAFGSSDTPTTSGADPTDTANTMAAWVIEYGLDGIDVDYEVRLNAAGCFSRLIIAVRILMPWTPGQPKPGWSRSRLSCGASFLRATTSSLTHVSYF